MVYCLVGLRFLTLHQFFEHGIPTFTTVLLTEDDLLTIHRGTLDVVKHRGKPVLVTVGISDDGDGQTSLGSLEHDRDACRNFLIETIAVEVE